jgi:hypothetical protein
MSTASPIIGERLRIHSVPRWSVRLAGAVLLVVGVALVGAAPAGAAPTVGDDDVTIADNESRIGIEDDHSITVSADDVNTTGGAATVTVDLSGWPDDAITGQPSVTIPTSGVAVVGSVDTSGTEVTFDVNDTNTAEIDFDAEINVTLQHPTTASADGASYEVDAGVTDADGTTTASAPVTLLRLSHVVDGEERFPPDTEFIFQGQELTVQNLDPGVSYTLFEFDPEDETLGDPINSVSPGGTATATIDTEETSLETGWYIVYDGNDIATVEENAFQVQTHQLSASQATGEVDATGDGANTSVTIDSPLRTTAFDVNVTSPELDAEELFEIFEGESRADVERIHGSDSTIVVRNVTAGNAVSMTFASVPAATYEFDFTAVDTDARAGSSVTVVEREADAEFGSDVFESQTGDIVEVSISLQDTGDAYVMIGGDRPSDENTLTNYFDILHVQGGATIQINTRLLGTNAPSEEVYATDSGSVTSYLQDPNDPAFDDVTFEGDAQNLDEFRAQIGITDIPRPLQRNRYRLVAGLDGSVIVRDDGIPDFKRPLARSNIHLTESEGFGNVTTYIAPEGSANDVNNPDGLGELTGELTERRTIAKGDRLVFEIEARGLTGLVTWLQERLDPKGEGIDPSMLETLLSFPDGFRIDGTETNPSMNEPTTSLEIGGVANGELYVVPEPIAQEGNSQYLDRYYLVIDTRGTGPFNREPEPGERYRFRFGYNSTGETDWFDTVDHDAIDPNGAPPHFPYHDADAGNQTESRVVTIEEPTVEYDRVDDEGRPILRNSGAATISGVSNVAPGTEVSIQLVADNRTEPTKITIDDVEIGSGGVFEVSHDISALQPDSSVEIEFYVNQRLLDKRSAVVVDDSASVTDFRIVDHAGNATVKTGGSLDRVTATVENDGVVSDRQSIELAIAGTVVGEQALALEGDEREAIDFASSTAAVDPGEYTYTITTGDDEVTGQLLVEATESDEETTNNETADTTDVDPTPDQGSAAEADENEGDDGGQGNDDESEETPDEDPLGPLDELVGMVALPVGSRHAIGGAAVVGAAHVLGYWI